MFDQDLDYVAEEIWRGTSARAKAMSDATPRGALATPRGARDIPGVLLAGGLARRMGGGDKPMRTIAGRTILDRVIARLKPQCDGLILNANGDPARFAAFRLACHCGRRRRFSRTARRHSGGARLGCGEPAGCKACFERRRRLPVPAARSGVAAPCRARSRECRTRRCRFRRPVASGDRTLERRFARTTSPRAGCRRRQEDRPLDRAISGLPP